MKDSSRPVMRASRAIPAPRLRSAGAHSCAARRFCRRRESCCSARMRGPRARSTPTASAASIVVFLRGAVDGLNVVVPHGEPAYYDARPTIAIGRTGASDGVIDLDGHFGMHPALAPMDSQWRDGTLAFVHACGSPDPTRSHFDAQDFMESGTPGVKSTQDGWLNRTLAAIPGTHGPTEASESRADGAADSERQGAGREYRARTRGGKTDADGPAGDRSGVRQDVRRQRFDQPRVSRRTPGAHAACKRTDAGYDGSQCRRAVAAGILRRHRPPRAADWPRPHDSRRVHGARRLGYARQRRRGATASSRDI